jgi:hypothetical protein
MNIDLWGPVLAMALLGALVEFRLHKFKGALNEFEKVEHQRVINEINTNTEKLFQEAILNATQLTKGEKATLDVLSQHIALLDEEMGEVKKELHLERRVKVHDPY